MKTNRPLMIYIHIKKFKRFLLFVKPFIKIDQDELSAPIHNMVLFLKPITVLSKLQPKNLIEC